MSNTPISGFPQTTPQSNDLLPIARAGANYSVPASSLAAAGALKTIQRTITSNEIKNLATSPLQILAPVAGQGIFITQAALTYIPGTTPYTDPVNTSTSTITSVDAPTVTTDTLTQVTPLGISQPSWAGIVKLSGTITAQDALNASVQITGFANSANNGTFPVVGGDYSAGNSFVLVLNPNAVAETHSGTLHRATAVYHGDNSSGSVFPSSNPYAIQGLSHTGNNGPQICIAADATTMTFANVSAVAETHAGTAPSTQNGAGGQVFVLYIPSSSLLAYILPFSANLGVDAIMHAVSGIAGTLSPRTCFVGGPTSPQVNGIGTSGQGLFFSLASENTFNSNEPNAPSTLTPAVPAAQNLTGGDGTFQLTVSYFTVQTA